jgi:transcriptional antiterminator
MKTIQKHIDWLNTNTLTQEELAEKKGVTSRTIRNKIRKGEITQYKLKAIVLHEK